MLIPRCVWLHADDRSGPAVAGGQERVPARAGPVGGRSAHRAHALLLQVPAEARRGGRHAAARQGPLLLHRGAEVQGWYADAYAYAAAHSAAACSGYLVAGGGGGEGGGGGGGGGGDRVVIVLTFCSAADTLGFRGGVVSSES